MPPTESVTHSVGLDCEAGLPAVSIELELEGLPQVWFANESEEERPKDWINSRPELVDLIQRALDLGDTAEAA